MARLAASLLLLAVLGALGNPGAAGQAPSAAPVPPEFQALYTRLDGRLSAFLRRLDREGRAARSPLVFATGIITANSNNGEALLAPQNYQLSLRYLDRLQELGVTGITLEINFPLLAPEFQGEGRAQAYLAFYRRLTAEIRRRGLAVAIESTAIFPGYSNLPVAPYYRRLSLEEYREAKGRMLRLIAIELRPDYLTVSEEPDTEAANTGQPVNTLHTAAALVAYYLSQVRPVAGPAMRLGAGFGTWQEDYLAWTRRYTQLGLDFLNIHIYPVDGDLLDRTLAIADLARQNGKPTAVHEAWLYKWEAGERAGVAASQEVFARDAYSFWAPLDQKFIEALVRTAHVRRFAYVSPFWSNFFFAYLDYEAARQLTAGDRLRRSLREGLRAALAGTSSPTGLFYRSLIPR